MARVDVERGQEADHAHNDLFDDEDATFDDLLEAMQNHNASPVQQQASRRDAQSSLPQEMLGIEEEVTIKKVRKPVVKLDESR